MSFKNFAKSMNGFLAKEISNKAETEDLFLDTNEPSLNWLLGGGFNLNRINVLSGPCGVGKSFLAIKACVELLKKNPKAGIVLIDSEYYYHNQPSRIQRLQEMGIDLERLFIISENRPDLALSSIYQFEGANEKEMTVCAIIIDSINGFIDVSSETKLNSGKISDSANTFAGLSKVLKVISKGLNGISARNNITVFLTAHCYLDLSYQGAGKRFIVSGGDQFKYFAENIVLLTNVDRKDSKIGATGQTLANDAKEDFFFTGKTIRAVTQKSRSSVEGRKVDLKINFETMSFIDKEESLFNLALNLGIISKKNSRVFIVPTSDVSEEEIIGSKNVIKKFSDINIYNYLLKKCINTKTKTSAVSPDFTTDDVYEEG